MLFFPEDDRYHDSSPLIDQDLSQCKMCWFKGICQYNQNEKFLCFSEGVGHRYVGWQMLLWRKEGRSMGTQEWWSVRAQKSPQKKDSKWLPMHWLSLQILPSTVTCWFMPDKQQSVLTLSALSSQRDLSSTMLLLLLPFCVRFFCEKGAQRKYTYMHHHLHIPPSQLAWWFREKCPETKVGCNIFCY